MAQREQTIKKQWTKIETRLHQENHEAFTRLIPLVTVAKDHPTLQQLFPHLSHEFLCFSLKSKYPWSAGYPYVASIPNVSDFAILSAVREISDFKVSSQLLQAFVNKYHFLQSHEQPFIVFDIEGKIIKVPHISDAIDWIFEQTQGMYTVFENGKSMPNQDEILGNYETQVAIDVLASKIECLTT